MNESDLAEAKAMARRVNAQRVAAGYSPVGASTSLPDIPACDFCGKPYSANLACSACQSVFYCSPACQRAHWKQQDSGNSGGRGGHRAECKTMRETCEKMAKIAVQQMNDNDSAGFTRIDNSMLSTLDGTGAYRAAVASGLHEAIRQLFIDDKAELLKRYADPKPSSPRFCYTNSVMSALFRGQRMEGQGMSNHNFGCIDGQRIKMYVKSHPDSFASWWEASLEVYTMTLDNSVWKLGKDGHFLAHTCARDLWAAWSLVFVDKRASRAILLPGSDNHTASANASGGGSSSDARAKYLTTTLHKTLSRRWSVSDDRDPGCVLEGMLNQVAALIHSRLVEYKISPIASNFVKLLKLKGINKAMYEDRAVPVAKAMIAKGGTLTNDESKIAIRGYPSGIH